MERKDKMIMLNTTNNVVSKKNISMKYCNAEFINKDGRIVVYCNSGFYGNAVSDFASCLYNFFSDVDVDIERMVITKGGDFTRDSNITAVKFHGVIKDLPMVVKHFAELDKGWWRIYVNFAIEGNELSIQKMSSGPIYPEYIIATSTSVTQYNHKTGQFEEAYSYENWNDFLNTDFEDVAGKVDYARRKGETEENKEFCLKNTYRFTVSCPNGVYHLITKPIINAPHENNSSVERFAKALAGWKKEVNRQKKGLATFYDYILKEFITTAKRVAPEAVSGCVGMYSYYYTNDVYTDYPLPYEEIVITKMEKIENLDEVVKDTVIKL